MGFIDNISSRIRTSLRKDKSRVAMRISSGATSPATSGGFDLLQSYGNNALSEYLKVDQDILTRYQDYYEMDDYPEISAAINIFADDATQPDLRHNKKIWISSENDRIQEIGERLLHRTLRMDEEIWEIARSTVKTGNDFEEMLVTADGVVGLNFLPPETMRRIEGRRGEHFGFIQDFTGRTGFTEDEFKALLEKRFNPEDLTSGNADAQLTTAFEDWEVVHFRLRGKYRRSIYGHSALEPARWIFKRLTLLEDAALIYRLQRAPERFAFYVDIGDLPPAEGLAHLNRVRQMHKKKKYINPATGKMDLKYETLTPDDDFFIPVRKGQEGARIETLGAPQWQSMDDIEYFKNKLFAAIQIPKAYLGDEQGVVRAVLSSQDVRFARTILRIQNELRSGVSKIFRTHLAALNIDPYSVDYDVHMTVPSSIFELAQIEALSAKADLSARMGENFSQYWILSELWKMPDDEIEKIFLQKKEDAERMAAFQAYGQAKAQEILGDAMTAQAGDPAAQQGLPPGTQGSPQMAPPGAGGENVPAPPQLQSKTYTRLPISESRNLNNRGRGGISERELFASSPGADKRASAKIEKILREDPIILKRLNDIGVLLRDIRQSMPKK